MNSDAKNITLNSSDTNLEYDKKDDEKEKNDKTGYKTEIIIQEPEKPSINCEEMNSEIKMKSSQESVPNLKNNEEKKENENKDKLSEKKYKTIEKKDKSIKKIDKDKTSNTTEKSEMNSGVKNKTLPPSDTNLKSDTESKKGKNHNIIMISFGVFILILLLIKYKYK